MSGYEQNITYEGLVEEERALSFLSFDRKDALNLGLLIHKKAEQRFDIPLTIEITINSLVVFRYFPNGSVRDSEAWMARKRNSVELMSMSSLRFLYWLEQAGSSLEKRHLRADEYAVAGGGYPILIKGTGCVGSICVSGLPDHYADHAIVVDSIREYLKETKQYETVGR